MMCMCCPGQTHYVAYGSNTCNKGLGPFLFYPRRPGVLVFLKFRLEEFP